MPIHIHVHNRTLLQVVLCRNSATMYPPILRRLSSVLRKKEWKHKGVGEPFEGIYDCITLAGLGVEIFVDWFRISLRRCLS